MVSQQNWKDGVQLPLGGGVLRAMRMEKGSWPEVLKLGPNAPQWRPRRWGAQQGGRELGKQGSSARARRDRSL